MAVSKVMSLLLQEAIVMAEQVASSKSGVPTPEQDKRSRIVFPYLMKSLQNGSCILLNRDNNPIGIPSQAAIHPEEWHLYGDLCVKNSPALSAVLDVDGSVCGTPNPWKTRAQAKQYAHRMRLLAAAIGAEVN